MTPRRCFPLCSPSLFLVLSKPKIPASVFKNWLPQLRCSVDRWIRLAGWLLSTANDWSFAPEKVGLGLGKRTVLQLQSPSDILLSSHLHVCSILPHIHLVAPGTQATFSVGRIWLLYKVPVVTGAGDANLELYTKLNYSSMEALWKIQTEKRGYKSRHHKFLGVSSGKPCNFSGPQFYLYKIEKIIFNIERLL